MFSKSCTKLVILKGKINMKCVECQGDCVKIGKLVSLGNKLHWDMKQACLKHQTSLFKNQRSFPFSQTSLFAGVFPAGKRYRP